MRRLKFAMAKQGGKLERPSKIFNVSFTVQFDFQTEGIFPACCKKRLGLIHGSRGFDMTQDKFVHDRTNQVESLTKFTSLSGPVSELEIFNKPREFDRRASLGDDSHLERGK